MKKLFLKNKRPVKILFTVIVTLSATGVFIILPVKALADDFFVITQLPTQLDKTMSVLSGFINNNNGKSSYVWFDYGTNGKFEKSSVKNKTTGKRDFSSFIYDLEPGVTYSYRAAAREKDSSRTKYGDTKTFIIGSKSYANNSVSDGSSQQENDRSEPVGEVSGSQKQVTSSIKPVTSSSGDIKITNTSVELHSIVLTGGVSTRGWFEWGSTKDLGRVTPSKKLGDVPKIEMKETVYGLSPNTTYYYRSVAVTEGGMDKGTIMSFTTKNTGSVVEESKEVSKPNDVLNSGNVYIPAKDSSIGDDMIADKTDTVEIVSDQDLLESSFGWGLALREQFFTVDENGRIDAKSVFSEKKDKKQSFLLASSIFGKKILPSTWSEWGFITILLYLVISRLHYFFAVKRKKKKEMEETEKELQEARDMQTRQNNGNIVQA